MHPVPTMNSSPAIAARSGGRAILAAALRDSRQRTLALLDAYVDKLGETLVVPYSTQLNPPLWEAGHVAWFQDYWVARNRQRGRGVRADPEHERPDGRLPQADALYNSSHVPHATRWALPLPDLSATRGYLAAVLGRDTGPARRHPGNRRRPVFLPPRAVSRGHARRSRGLHGAGARYSAARHACSQRRKPCRKTPRCTFRRSGGRWAMPAPASPSTTNWRRMPSILPRSRSTAPSSPGRATCPSSKPPAPRRHVTSAGRATPGKAVFSAPGAGAAARRAGHPSELVRGRCLVPLGRASPAD